MTPADVVALAAFFSIIVAGLILRALRDIGRRRPAKRIAHRLDTLLDGRGNADKAKPKPRGEREAEPLLSRANRYRDHGEWETLLRGWAERVATVGGRNAIRKIVLGAAAACVFALIVTGLARLAPLPRAAIVLAMPFVAARIIYAWMVANFKQRFLAVFPDTLDLIIRAVRAGIPAVQAICTAGVESEEPVRATFRTMGDALLVGAELKETLEQAADRLQLADFSFFAVCLVLQRETGGNLADTLENLAGIVRTRRDIRAKTRALTAEGRIASKIISAVPFWIMGFLYIVNRPYVSLLFNTRAGHKMLVLAAVLLAIGLAMIRKIANLDTSR